MYDPIDRNLVAFDKFSGFQKSVKKFKKTLKNFAENENQFSDAAIFGIMWYTISQKAK